MAISNLLLKQKNHDKLASAPNQESALKLHSRAAQCVEEHHHVNGPDTGRNSGGRQI